jgi:hypothetical protein
MKKKKIINIWLVGGMVLYIVAAYAVGFLIQHFFMQSLSYDMRMLFIVVFASVAIIAHGIVYHFLTKNKPEVVEQNKQIEIMKKDERNITIKRHASYITCIIGFITNILMLFTFAVLELNLPLIIACCVTGFNYLCFLVIFIYLSHKKY